MAEAIVAAWLSAQEVVYRARSNSATAGWNGGEMLVNGTGTVDDEPVGRTGVRHLLRDADWLAVVGEAATGPAAVQGIGGSRSARLLGFTAALSG